MPKVSPEHVDARKRQILDAALRCFSKHGFHNTTMKEIVEESELSAGAIYNYYSGKGDIINAIARKRHVSENALLMGSLAKSDKPVDLQGLARAFFGSFAGSDHREARRVGVEVWAEALRNPDVLETVLQGVDEPRHLLARIVSECQERDELPTSIDPEGFARVMVAIFQGFVLQQAWDPDIDTGRYLATVGVILAALSGHSGD